MVCTLSHMLRITLAVSVMLGLCVGLTIIGRPPASAAMNTGRTHGEMCNVVQEAFMAATNNPSPAYPKDIEASSHPIGRLETFVNSYVAQMGLTGVELADLISQQGTYSIEHFTPMCDWTGKPQSVMDGQTPMRVEFSNPIFSSDSNLAITQISFLGRGRWGYGKICILRKTASDWAARCIAGWIS